MNNKVLLLTVILKNKISFHEIHLFRGAILKALGNNSSVLFHNHTDNTYRFAYPLIQYKRIQSKAAIVCIQQGTEDIGQLFASGLKNFTLGDKELEARLESVRPMQYRIQVWDSYFNYRLNRWLALNPENYKRYRATEGVAERAQFLEKILVGNILSFAKGIGYNVDKEIKCNITKISEPYLLSNKKIKLTAFDIEFRSNISLPDYIGLGKNASIGFGVITHIKQKDEQ